MKAFKKRLFSSIFMCLLLLTCITACGNGNSSASTGTPQSTKTSTAAIQSTGGNTTLSASSSSANPTVSVDCPVSGTGRAAVMPALQTGNDQNIIYLAHSASGSLMDIKRYDVQTKATMTIATLPVKTAQVSQDGKWLLLSEVENGVAKMQLLRIDGKFLQTLYCAPQGQLIDPGNSSGMQWSPDQQHVIFVQGADFKTPRPLYMLNLNSGNVQVELTPSQNYLPMLAATWLDNTHIYVVAPDASSLFLLDSSKGPNQSVSDMQKVKGVGDAMWDFDTSADGKTLYMSLFMPLYGTPDIQAEIDAEAPNGKGMKQLLLSRNLAITGIRVINASSIMLVSYIQNSPYSKNNGLWKVNTDGTGLTHLTTEGTDSWQPFNHYTQYLWSNFSRNGAYYTDGPSYGSLNGGPLTRYTTDSDTQVVGWTTM